MINRLEATRHLVDRAPQALFVAGLGNPKFDLAGSGDRPQHFYIWNAMGLAPSVGLGLALAQPQRQVIVLDSDGALVHAPNALFAIARMAPPNLLHIVWDNGIYQLTGGQETPTAHGADLLALARAAGIQHCARVDQMAEFSAGLSTWLGQPGPWFVHALIDRQPATGRPPKDPTFIKHRFMDHVLG